MQSGAASADRPRARGYNDQGAEVVAGGSATGLRYSTYDMVKYVAHQLDEQDEAVALTHKSTWDTLDKQHRSPCSGLGARSPADAGCDTQ